MDHNRGAATEHERQNQDQWPDHRGHDRARGANVLRGFEAPHLPSLGNFLLSRRTSLAPTVLDGRTRGESYGDSPTCHRQSEETRNALPLWLHYFLFGNVIGLSRGGGTVARQEDGRATVLREIRSLFELGSCGDLTDGQLLERFITGARDSAEAAFTALVERHGPMVWRVCRRVLGDGDQAQDAFQATFLVLVKQAGSVHRKDSVASWLHGVAHRVASCARAAESRRRKHEERYAGRQIRVSQSSRSEDAEMARLLDEELCRLPERFCAAIVLCDLEEATHDQAAVRLGWPVGTVKSRLAAGSPETEITPGPARSRSVLGTGRGGDAAGQPRRHCLHC